MFRRGLEIAMDLYCLGSSWAALVLMRSSLSSRYDGPGVSTCHDINAHQLHSRKANSKRFLASPSRALSVARL